MTSADTTVMNDTDTMIHDIEEWLTATVKRESLNTRDIKELQGLLLDVRTFLVQPTQENPTPEN